MTTGQSQFRNPLHLCLWSQPGSSLWIPRKFSSMRFLASPIMASLIKRSFQQCGILFYYHIQGYLRGYGELVVRKKTALVLFVKIFLYPEGTYCTEKVNRNVQLQNWSEFPRGSEYKDPLHSSVLSLCWPQGTRLSKNVTISLYKLCFSAHIGTCWQKKTMVRLK